MCKGPEVVTQRRQAGWRAGRKRESAGPGVRARTLLFSHFSSPKWGSKGCLAKMIECNDESKTFNLMLSTQLVSGNVNECGGRVLEGCRLIKG